MLHEQLVRQIVKTSIIQYAKGFSKRHIDKKHKSKGLFQDKLKNQFIAALTQEFTGKELLFYSALVRSFDSSLGNMLESMAIIIAELNYEVKRHVEGDLYLDQTSFIADILEQYKSNTRKPQVSDYLEQLKSMKGKSTKNKRHESDYYIIDNESGKHYLIELKAGGDLDNKKARSEKEALLEQYTILTNSGINNVKIYFATAYNKYGEGNERKQTRVRQFFANEELLIGRDFRNFVCKSDKGFDVIIDEYSKNASNIIEAIKTIKDVYL